MREWLQEGLREILASLDKDALELAVALPVLETLPLEVRLRLLLRLKLSEKLTERLMLILELSVISLVDDKVLLVVILPVPESELVRLSLRLLL